MKKIALWNNYTEFANNKIFDEKQYTIGEDLGAPFIKLKEKLEALGYQVETLDMGKPSDYDKVIFFDYPMKEKMVCDINEIPFDKRILVITECEMIYNQNSRTDLLSYFTKVFTYNDDLVSRCGYQKINIPNVKKQPLKVPFCDKKLITLIAGCKTSNEYGELYSARAEFIAFMEKNHPEEFEFYGMGWDLYTFTSPFSRLNRFRKIRKIMGNRHICYKGSIDRKLATQSNYKFVFAYENTSNINGYISEKIWDAFFSGCIPIYCGAPNIKKYIPSECFIDGRMFDDYESLYSYIKNMSEDVYNNYLEKIKSFIETDEAYKFYVDFYVEEIIEKSGIC